MFAIRSGYTNVIICIHHPRSTHCSEDLSEHVDWEFSPRETCLMVRMNDSSYSKEHAPRNTQLANVTAGLMWPPEIPLACNPVSIVAYTGGLLANTYIHTEHHTDTLIDVSCCLFCKKTREDSYPAPTNALIVALGVVAQYNLSDHTITEHDQHEDAHELRKCLSARSSDPRPC